MNALNITRIAIAGTIALGGIISAANQAPSVPTTPTPPVALNSVLEEVQTQYSQIDWDCETPICKEQRIQQVPSIVANANNQLNKLGAFNLKIDTISRNDDGTWWVSGDIVEDYTSTRAQSLMGAGMFLGLFGAVTGADTGAGETFMNGVKTSSEAPEYIQYDEAFANVKGEVSIILDSVNFDNLEGVEKGKIITVSNVKMTKFGKNGSCGLFDSCSKAYSGGNFQLDAKSANGTSFKF